MLLSPKLYIVKIQLKSHLIDLITAEPKEPTIKNVGSITSGHFSIWDFEFGGKLYKVLSIGGSGGIFSRKT